MRPWPTWTGRLPRASWGSRLTSDSSDRGSTYALGAVQANVLSFYLQKLQRDLEDVVMNEQVIKRLVGYNFPAGTNARRSTWGGWMMTDWRRRRN